MLPTGITCKKCGDADLEERIGGELYECPACGAAVDPQDAHRNRGTITGP